MSAALVDVKVEGAEQLARAIQDFRALIKDDTGVALAKAARLVALEVHRGLRQQPPRPIKGTINAAAIARSYRINPASASYKTGRASADKILSGVKSGYFRLSDTGNGVLRAFPVLLGAKGRVLSESTKRTARTQVLSNISQLSPARRKDTAAYRKLLRGNRRAARFLLRKQRLRALITGNQIPDGAVQLNRGALAALRAIGLREKAASGGYLASQFLSYKGVYKLGSSTKFYTKDKKLAGTIDISEGNQEDGGAIARITGFLPGTAQVIERAGLVEKALQSAAITYQADILEKIKKRGAQNFAKAFR